MSSGVDTPLTDVRPVQEPQCLPESGCITCGDVAEEMRVLRIDADRELALCEHVSGERQTVEIALVQPVTTSDVLLVHAGTAITNLDHEAAPDPDGADAGADDNARGVAAGQVFSAGAEHPSGSGSGAGAEEVAG